MADEAKVKTVADGAGADDGIDVVVTWVDGSDPAWRAQKEYHQALAQGRSEQEAQAAADAVLAGAAKPAGGAVAGAEDERFRDWDLLRYWFRGIEKNAPWVRTVHFVTWGHVPAWLDVDHPKIHVVRHEDYLPAEWLPTFNSRTIMTNLHRIPGLSERFVLFNDDMYLIAPTTERDFFKGGLPTATAVHTPARIGKNDTFLCSLNDAAVMNEHFPMRGSVLRHFGKWINPKYGTAALSTLLLIPFPAWYGFLETHLCNSYLKSTFAKVWEAEPEFMAQIAQSRFRRVTDVNDWVMKNWQLCEGTFVPRPLKFGRVFLERDFGPGRMEEITGYITGRKGKVVCINDGAFSETDLDQIVPQLREAFDAVLGEKSSFER